MYYIYIFIVLVALYILIFRKRYFDFVTLYVFCLVLFNISTFFHFVVNPYTGGFDEPNEHLYFISSIPLIFSIPFLLRQPRASSGKDDPNFQQPLILIFIYILIIVFLISVFDNREALFNSLSKKESLENSNLSRMLLGTISVIGTLISIKRKSILFITFFLSTIIFMLLTGARAPLAIVGICFFIYLLYPNKILIAAKIQYLLFGFIGLVITVLGKKFYGLTMALGLTDGFYYWLDNFDSSYFMQGSEFLSTPVILNSVLEHDFSIPFADVPLSLMAILPIPMSFWGLSSGVFNERFQPILFNGIEYGMAYNIWGEAYSWLGVIGVAIFSFLIPLSLNILWKQFLKYYNNLFSFTILYIGVYISFFIHRNSLGTILGSIRNVFYPMLIISVISNFIYLFLKKQNK